MAAQSVPTLHSRCLEARALRLGQSVTELTRYSGWQSVADQELNEARQRHNDNVLGGEELLSIIEADALQASEARKASKGAI